MNNGKNRFVFHLTKVEALLSKADKQKSAAAFLIKNNARTPFFMLEGLAKLYGDLHNKKKFTKLKEHFKIVEDGLGAIDYYQALLDTFSKNKSVPAACITYLKKMLVQKTDKLNTVLVENGWLKSTKRITKINEKLAEAEWLNATDEVKAITAFYGEAIYDINEFVTETKFHFDNIEEDVHELRRKIRWLSIYPQALGGAIQYTKETKTKTTAALKKYLTKEIITSPFNKLPAKGKNEVVVEFNKNYFLALSWFIAKLGNLKDEGLLITGLKEAIQQTTPCADDVAYKKAYTILGKKYRQLPAILKEAESVTKTFFMENNLEYLLFTPSNL